MMIRWSDENMPGAYLFALTRMARGQRANLIEKLGKNAVMSANVQCHEHRRVKVLGQRANDCANGVNATNGRADHDDHFWSRHLRIPMRRANFREFAIGPSAKSCTVSSTKWSANFSSLKKLAVPVSVPRFSGVQ